METKKKKSFLSNIPSWVLAVITLIGATIVYFISDALMTLRSQTGTISNIINDILIATGCFFIIKRNPKSILYVPLICNALLIISSIVEPNF